MNKKSKLNTLITASVILVNAIPVITLPVKAGVMQRMIEVDAMEAARQEAERISAQENYRIQEIESLQSIPQVNLEELPIVQPLTIPTSRISATPFFQSKPEKSSDKKCYLCKVTGAVLGMGIGSASGFMRGSISKSAELSSDFNDSFGQGTASNIAAGTAGAVTGFVAGAGTGVLNGMLTGVIEGWSNPFTSESFSIKGKFLDYDPFEFLGGGQN
jgi:hypothetical protein